jgi:Mn2+/Fe2+ NRAMP family transporter
MKEIVLYAIAAISSVVVLGYTVHMFVGGLVKPETETRLIIIACILGALVVGAMAWDVIRRRRK